MSVLYRGLASEPPPLSSQDVILAFAIGLPLALFAAATPALEASRVPPTSAIRGSDRLDTRFRLKERYLLLPLTLFLVGGYLSTLGPLEGLPAFGFMAAMAFVFGGAFLTPAVLYGLGKIGRSPIKRIFKVEGQLAHANLSGSIPRLSISVAALSISLSMMVAIAVMVGSFRETVIYWAEQTLRADLFVGPSARSGEGAVATVSGEVERILAAHPSVAAIDRFRRQRFAYRDTQVSLGAGDFAVLFEHGNLLFKSPHNGKEALKEAMGREAIIVSESFATKHNHDVGDSITLSTARGKRSFEIVAVYFDYSNEGGIIVMDRSTFARNFGDPQATSLSIYLHPGSNPEEIRGEIISKLGDDYRVTIYTNASIREEVLRVFDSTFTITYALEAIAVFVAILGVATTLVTLILERRRELAVLRLIGADRRQVRRMVVLEATLMGAASQGIGIGVGLVLSLLLIYVINVQSFGWTIQFNLPAQFLFQMSLLILLATGLSGIYPANRACRLPAVEQVVEE
jgi:putative ABC transport system permease protein